MNKIIAAFDGLDYSESTKDYALFFAKQMNAHLVAVFMEDFTRHSYSVAEITSYQGTFNDYFEERSQKDQEMRKAAIAAFERDCRAEKVNYSIHKDRNIAVQELIHESIYSDLLIIGYNETMTRYEEEYPTRFIRDLLTDVQCPVLLVPTEFRIIGKNVLLYDGAPSS